MKYTKKTKVAIVGAGALGSYYGARLVEAGVEVHFLMRSDYDHVVKHGMRITSIDGDVMLPEVVCHTRVEDIGEVDLVIVTWKTTSNHLFEEMITPLLHEGTELLTLQNGLGSADLLAGLFGGHRVFGGLCFIGVNRLGPGDIHHYTSGLIKVGSYDSSDGGGNAGELAEFMLQSGIRCEAVDSLGRAQWMKLVWNIPFNGLAIVEGGIDTEALLEMNGVEGRVRRIMNEIQVVAGELGYLVDNEFIEGQISVTRLMKKYRPSSMIDFINGREVELDTIWLEPLRRAHELEVAVPEIERLCSEIIGCIERRA